MVDLCSFLKSEVSSIIPRIALAIRRLDCLSDSSASILLSSASISPRVFSSMLCTDSVDLSRRSWNMSTGSRFFNLSESTVSQISFQVEPFPKRTAALSNSSLILSSPSGLTTLQSHGLSQMGLR